MNSKINAWALKEIPEDKKFLFLALTLILAFFSNNIANRGLSELINFVNQPAYPSNYSFGIFGILLIIPAALLSVWIVNRLDSLQHRLLNSRIADKIWLITYSFKKNRVYKNKLSKSSTRNSNTMQGFQATPQRQAQKSQEETDFANKQKLQATTQWQAHMRQEEDFANKQKLQADTQRQAHKRKEEVDFANKQRLQADAQRLAQKKQEEADFANKQRLQDEARWQARKRQEEADFAKRRAIEQAQYNSKLHLQEKINRANAKQHEANEAAKRARNF
ncbi:hypothetical protein [Paenisporosarcina sp. TG-14]|uniref:hypothetical protein n=1 Tax=Paenisporosarcina sp. TG-14 TaxID=1231057 RepID=UPI000307EABD|nr:hypothetical protein [Paenisporosarcina sp. TG-14]